MSRTRFDESEIPVCCCVIVPIHTNRLCCCYSGVGIINRQEIQHMCSPKTTLAQTLKKVSTYRNMAAPATYLKNRPLTGANTPLESVPFPVSCRGDGFFVSDSQPLKMEPVPATWGGQYTHHRGLARPIRSG